MNIIDLCINKEKSNFKNIKGFNLFESELNTNEVHFKVKNKEFRVLRKHDNICEPRLDFFNWLLKSSGIDYQKIDCEFIINLDDDPLNTDFYAPRISFTKRDLYIFNNIKSRISCILININNFLRFISLSLNTFLSQLPC